MFGQDREQLRRFYQDTWRKHARGDQLAGMEALVAQVIGQHPEYHACIADPAVLDQDFSVESGQTNPFLHMGMHIALAEQLQMDRPPGIRALYRVLCARASGAHEAEHRMMECLGQALWDAQRNQTVPDEAAYLACIRKLTLK